MRGRVDFSAELILVCNSLDAGGIERVVSTLANEWSRRGRKVSVVTLNDRNRFYTLDPQIHHVVVEQQGTGRAARLAEFMRKIRARALEFRYAKSALLGLLGPSLSYFISQRIYRTYFRLYLALETLELRRVLERIESEVVVAFGTSVNVITLKACRGMARRVIVSERNHPAQLIKIWEQLWLKHYREAYRVTANTQSALNDMRDFVDLDKLAFVPNPLRLPNGNENGNGDLGKQKTFGEPFVLTVGRLVEDKAQDVLLEAFARTGDEFKNWRLAIIGDGRLEKSLRAQAQALGIANRIDWHGVVQDPFRFYHTAHVFALPSRVEGTPNALLEAMSCGLPVVVSDGAPGPLELVEDGVTGLVVPVNDPSRLADALRRLGRDGPLRERLGAAARERVSEYELPRALARWESVVGLTC